MQAIAVQAAEQPYIEKIAADANISEQLIRHLASRCRMQVIPFVKAAYADVDDFLDVLQAVAGVQPMTKKADIKTLLGKFLSSAKGAFSAARDKSGPAANSATTGLFERSTPGGSGIGSRVMNAVERHSPLGGSRAGRIATLGTGGGLGVAGIGGMAGGGNPNAGPVESAVAPMTNPAAQAAGGAPGAAGGAPGAPGAAPAAPPASPAAPGEAKGPGVGKMLGMGAAGLAGGAGVAALINRRRNKKPKPAAPTKEASARDLACLAMRKAIVKKAAAMYVEESKEVFCSYLDKVASLMPIARTGNVRVIQREIATGHSLGHAIKVAFPNLIPEKRGILAAEMVRKAAAWKKQANAGMSSGGPQSWNGPLAGASEAMAGMTGSPGMSMGASPGM